MDRRADIWAFGCVLFEMLAGESAFTGETVTDVLAAVVDKEPEWSALPAATSPTIRRLLQRCLAKDQTLRLPHIGAARLDLFDALAHPDDAVPAADVVSKTFRRAPLPWAIAAISAMAAIGLGVSREWSVGSAAVVRSIIRAEGPLGPRDRDLALSPDGRLIVYAANGRLYARDVSQLRGRAIAGTDGAHGPFFAPTGESLGFFSGNRLMRVGLAGEVVQTVATVVNGQHGTWSDDGWIYFALATPSGIFRVRDTGGEPEAVTTRDDDLDHNFPMALPGGRAILIGVYRAGDRNWNDAGIVAHSTETGERRTVVDAGSNAHYLTTGHVVYHRDGALLAVPFDPDRLQARGVPVVVHEHVLRDSIGQNALFAASEDGSLVYVGASPGSGLSTLVVVDRTGAETTLKGEPGVFSEPRFSPDGSRVALTMGTRVAVHDMARGTTTSLAGENQLQRWPLWLPDGEHVLFTYFRDGAEMLYRQAADGTGQPMLVSEFTQALAVSSDGHLISRRAAGDQRLAIGVSSLDGDRTPRSLRLSESLNETTAALSRDGRLIAYELDEPGGPHLYVRPFPATDTGRLLIGAGRSPVWGPSAELFFSDTAGSVLDRTVVRTGPSLRHGAVERFLDTTRYSLLVETRNVYLSGLANFDVSPDGTRFVMVKPVATDPSQGAPDEIVPIQNWFTEMREKMRAR